MLKTNPQIGSDGRAPSFVAHDYFRIFESLCGFAAEQRAFIFSALKAAGSETGFAFGTKTF